MSRRPARWNLDGWPADPDKGRRMFELARIVARNNLAGGQVALPLLIIVLGALAMQWVPVAAVLTWIAASLFGMMLSFHAARAVLKTEVPTHDDMRRLTGQMILTGAAFTAIWSTYGIVLHVPGDPNNGLLVNIFYYASIAGGAALNGPLLRHAVVHLLIYVPGALIVTLSMGATILLPSIAFLIYVTLMLGVAYSIHTMATNTLGLKDRNEDLLRALAAAKAVSDDARVRAEAASRAKSDFLANMSHELRTPLNAILGFSEIIRDQLMGPSNMRMYSLYARDIHASGHHLLSLINDILDLAKIESGRYEIAPAPVELKPLVEETLRLFTCKVERSQIELTADVPSSLVILADHRALKQILINLVSNAVKFTPEGGQIRIAAQMHGNGQVAISVSDTGVGIAPEDLPRVFEAFGQGRHDIATPEKGTGLGLPIVKGLIEAHGGSVTLTSRLTRGTTVSLHLPHAPGGTTAAAA